MELFKEGAISFYAENKQTRDSEVFFNPSRDFDRSLNILLFKALDRHDLTGVDLFGGSGIRSLRLAAETDAFKSFKINDLKTSKVIRKNVLKNKSKIRARITVTSFNASDIYSIQEGYDYIDIDPFGSPVRYTLQAMPKVKRGGIIALTATDTAALYGKAKKACALKYGSRSLKTSYFNEVGLRILIKRAEEIANLYERSVHPLFFDVRRHYIRTYLCVSKANITRDIGYIYQCSKCPNRVLKFSEKCSFCASKNIEVGPLWLDNLFDRKLVSSMFGIAQDEDAKKYLEMLKQEKDSTSYYTTTELASYLGVREKKIGSLGTRTVLNEKGFRYDNDFKKLTEEYKKLE